MQKENKTRCRSTYRQNKAALRLVPSATIALLINVNMRIPLKGSTILIRIIRALYSLSNDHCSWNKCYSNTKFSEMMTIVIIDFDNLNIKFTTYNTFVIERKLENIRL